ncbi:MAG: hypothetical protein M0017_05920 [Desulfobacteraceae bacterium]|nr:hypothetical protein [Desulfobacteraceae bacterium]
MTPPPFPFRDALRRLNTPALAAFDRWLLPPGTLFGDLREWWSGLRPRRRPHEGVDLCWYRRQNGQAARVAPGTKVPALAPGRVVRVVGDFLSHSVFVAHRAEEAGGTLVVVYGHVEPALATGEEIGEGGLLATLARPASGRVPPHLHLSLVLLPAGFSLARLDWDLLHASPAASFRDPLPLLGCPWEKVPAPPAEASGTPALPVDTRPGLQ